MADEVSVGATQGIIWTFVVVSTVFTVARLYTRLKIMNKIGLDDYLMVFSLVLPLLQSYLAPPILKGNSMLMLELSGKGMLLPLRHLRHSLNPLGHGPTHLPSQRRTTTQRTAVQHRIFHPWDSVIHSPQTRRNSVADSNIDSNPAVYDFPLGARRIDRFDYFRMCDYIVCAVFADEGALDADDA